MKMLDIQQISYLLIGLILVFSGDTPYVINISHIKSLTNTDNGCILKQTYNPHTIHTDQTCEEIQDAIDYANSIKSGY